MFRLLTFAIVISLQAQPRQVAITIDDLPRGGDTPQAVGRDLASIRAMTRKLLAPLRGVPVIGFVNAGRAPGLSQAGLQSILKLWLDSGAALGNHTSTHPDLNSVPLKEYEADLLAGEPAITKALGHRPAYFRHPFLHAGKDVATRQGLERFLKVHGYTIAPVTLDNSDYMFAAVYARAKDAAQAARVKREYIAYMESIFAFFEARSKEVVGRETAQTLLTHASQLNADAMPELLAMMRGRGYEFVSLETALKDPAYSLPDEYDGPGGFSWIHRWSQTRGMAPKGEPDEPAWLLELYKVR